MSRLDKLGGYDSAGLSQHDDLKENNFHIPRKNQKMFFYYEESNFDTSKQDFSPTKYFISRYRYYITRSPSVLLLPEKRHTNYECSRRYSIGYDYTNYNFNYNNSLFEDKFKIEANHDHERNDLLHDFKKIKDLGQYELL